MRFGHRPRVADTFCGSGQIPFEAARLGCDVYASDLNPVACMLTWGAFNIVGGSPNSRIELERKQRPLVEKVQAEIDKLDVESDRDGWRGRAYIYCFEARLPDAWLIPLLPSRIVSVDDGAIVDLVPDENEKHYGIRLRTKASVEDMRGAARGTVRTEARGQDPYVIHPYGKNALKISTLRGDFREPSGTTRNKLRFWEKSDFMPRKDDTFQERLYAIQWMRPKTRGKGYEFQYRTVTEDDVKREQTVIEFIARHLADWQKEGLIPDMRIESGQNTDQPIWERGWTYWHHLFNPRQLLVNGLLNRFSSQSLKIAFANSVAHNARLSQWDPSPGGRAGVKTVFTNQALNTLYNYGARGTEYLRQIIIRDYKSYPLPSHTQRTIAVIPAEQIALTQDVFVTDPPYGDAVNYHEILEFFIAWLRKNPPPEFADWVWDSRRALAIKGEGEDFRRKMVAAYKRMTACMPDNGIQVIMFTHQSGSIWADMANIVWASGLQVTAAWYVVTETDCPLREGAFVKGTVLLILRKRQGADKTTRDDLAWEIQEEVEKQVRDAHWPQPEGEMPLPR